MNVILDKLPNKYEDLFINTDFRISMLFELLMQDNEISDEEKLEQAVILYYDNRKGNLEKAFNNLKKSTEGILWFFRCGKEDEEEKQKVKTNRKEEKQIYSYEFDANYIYGAFKAQYNIDLQDDKLHWWKFKALFESLEDKNRIVEIMGYRSIDLGKIKDKDEKARYKKLKKIYALPDMRTKEQKEADFGSAFW